MKRILIGAFLAVMCFCSGVIFMIYRCGYILENKQKKLDKYLLYFNFLDCWLIGKEQNYNFADYFNENNIKTIAIYGMGQIGKHLKYELEKAGIKIAYVIDQGEKVIYGEEEHYSLHDELPTVDMVIVTPIEEFEEIKNDILNNNRMLKVISVDKIIDRNSF